MGSMAGLPKGGGNPPKSSALRKLMGNPGQKPIRETPSLSAPVSLEPPEGLPAAGCEEWRRLIGPMIAAGVLTEGDMGLFRSYCQAFAEVRGLDSQINAPGFAYAIVTRRGEQRINPIWRMAHEARSEMVKCATLLGLTPATRARVSAKVPEAAADPAEEWEARGKIARIA